MEQVLSALKNVPLAPVSAGLGAKQYEAAIKLYVASLGKVSEKITPANAAKILEALDPAVDSIAYLVVLNNVFQAPNAKSIPDRTVFLDKTIEFLVNFDPYQIRYVGYSLLSLIDHICSGAMFSPLISVELISSTILRLDPAGSLFTSTHLQLVKMAYEANCFEPALKVINANICFYPDMDSSRQSRPLFDKEMEPAGYISTQSGLTRPIKTAMVLEYNLLCGMIHIQRRDWAKAQKALERTISHPVKDKIPSKIMCDSYKKWILVGLLNMGTAPTIPSHTSSAAKGAYSLGSTKYDNLANLFSTDKASQLQADVQANMDTFEEEGNAALVREVLSAYQKWQVINLRKVYQPVSVARIRRMTLSAETGGHLENDEAVVNLVRNMIASGMLKGELQLGSTAEESYLIFQDDDTSLSEYDFAREIAGLHHSIEALGKQYKVTNERLAGSKEYVRHLVREQKSQANKEESDARRIDLEDEDLMTGIVSHS